MLEIVKKRITLTKGDDGSIWLRPRYKDKSIYTVQEGDRAFFRINATKSVIEIECNVNVDANKIVVSFVPNDTKDLAPGIYRYEAELITSWGMHYTFLANETFILGAEIEKHISNANSNGNYGNNIPSVDGELEDEPVVDGDIQPTNPSLDYETLNHLPKVNGNTLIGDKSNEQLGIPTKTSDLDNDSDFVSDDNYVHTDNNYDDTAKNAVDALGTASTYDVPESGNASTSQVVKGDDSRLRDNRDPNPHTHSKADITDFPTNVSAFNNDSGFITNTVNNLANYYLKSETYTRAEVEQLIAAIKQGKFEIVAELPASGDANVIYLVPKSTAQTSNSYDEYVYINNAWEKIGDTDIDLSGYVTDDELTTALQSYLTTSAFNTAIASYYTKTETDNLLANKVDKVAGKGLSTNDYDNTAKGIVDGVTSALNDKVDKAQGKGLSTNDYDNTAKSIVDGVTAALDGKADKSEMSVTDGTGTDADKTTIQLKSGTSATVLKTHQDISGKADKVSGATNGNLAGLDANGNLTDSGIAKTDVEEMQDELSTDYATVEGNPINFTTLSAQNAKSTILSLEPIQDLHGYDKPWVGGAGKNLLPLTVDGIKANNTDGTWTGNTYAYGGGTVTILTDNDGNVTGLKANGTFTKTLIFILGTYTLSTNTYALNGCASGGSSTTYYLDWRSDNNSQIIETGSSPYGYVYASSGQTGKLCRLIINNTTVSNLIFKPMIRLNSDPYTFAPYENICPITGHTEIGILGTGKNIVDDSKFVRKHAQTGVENDKWLSFDQYIPYKPNVEYVFTSTIGKQSVFLLGIYLYDDELNYVDNMSKTYVNPNNVSFTIPNTNAHYFRFGFYDASSLASYTPENPMLRLATESSDFEPYTKSTDLTISLGQTVYGGTLDVENGVLVVDRSYELLDGSSDENWLLVNNVVKQRKNTNMKAIANDQVATNNRCNMFDIVSDVDLFANAQYCMSFSSDQYMRFRTGADARFPTVADWESYLASNNLQVCYELATPITINLAPHTINLLKGVNNISTDGDKITLTYRNGKFATLDGAVPKMTFRGEDYTMGVDDIGLFLENLTKSTKTYIADPLLNFDGTVATYKKIMKQWFINNGVNVMDSTGITYLCERWYEITKQGWKGGTSFPAVGVSTGSTGTRFDNNVGMSVTPSTDTSANTDTYQGLPLFAITDCNWELDSDGNILITAIDGITDNFVRDDPTKFVGVMQQTGWVKKVDDASTQKYYYADDKDAYEDLVPLPEAIKLDGTVRSFVVHAKYMSGIVDSKMTCCSGIIPRRNISHDGLVTLPDNIGTQYSGGTSVDWSFLVWMQRIKYASLTSDGVLQGCCNYNYQYYVKVSETGVKRLILSSANGANLKVGSTVTFGAYAGNADRGQAATYSISGQDGAIITAIEDVTIDSTTYKAIYVDTTSTFDTVANGDATNGTTIVSTHHWVSGSCDNVKGNDGSPVSATNGVYPAKLQGIEFMVGGYEVFADVIMNISGGYYNPYYARKSTEQATSITSSMVQSTLKCAQPSSDAWRYIQKHGFDGEIFYPVSTGTSSSEYTKDGFYENGTTTSTGTREWLAFGYLGTGSGGAGLSSLPGSAGLGHGGWSCVARLSCNGNRGILLTT